MGRILANDVRLYANNGLTISQFIMLMAMSRYADDDDGVDDNGIPKSRGRDIYPTQSELSLDTRLPRATVSRNMRELSEKGLIRKHNGTRYSLSYSPMKNGGGNGTAQCYELNLSALARCIDAQATWNHLKSKHRLPRIGADELFFLYKKLGESAIKFQHDDWETRLWYPGYSGKILDWDGTEEGISTIDWSAPEQHVSNENSASVGNKSVAPVTAIGDSAPARCEKSNDFDTERDCVEYSEHGEQTILTTTTTITTTTVRKML